MTRGPRLLLRLGELTWGCLTNRQKCYTTNSAAETTIKGALKLNRATEDDQKTAWAYLQTRGTTWQATVLVELMILSFRPTLCDLQAQD